VRIILSEDVRLDSVGQNTIRLKAYTYWETQRREGSGMKTSRMLVLMLLVMTVASMSIATSVHASGVDAVEEWAYYLWEYYGR
jgi:hypothetical protein